MHIFRVVPGSVIIKYTLGSDKPLGEMNDDYDDNDLHISLISLHCKSPSCPHGLVKYMWEMLPLSLPQLMKTEDAATFVQACRHHNNDHR